MKKNKMMRIASVLLIAVLLSTCAISGTFAKYTTFDESSDKATVAKFGVSIEAPSTMFSNSYKDVATTYTAGENGDTITVQSSTEGKNVLAPGTNGTLAALTVTGTPEVDVKVTYSANLELTGWEVAGTPYCPIVFTVNGTEYKIGAIIDGEDAIANFEAAVEEAINDVTNTYDTNTDLSAVVSDDLTVSWKWDYEGNDDAKDTALGDAAAAIIELTIKTTITQVN